MLISIPKPEKEDLTEYMENHYWNFKNYNSADLKAVIQEIQK